MTVDGAVPSGPGLSCAAGLTAHALKLANSSGLCGGGGGGGGDSSAVPS